MLVDWAYGVAVDAGGVSTVGFFQGTADFDPGSGTFDLTSAVNSDDAFVSKLDNNGDFIWAGQMGGTSSPTFATGVALDASGNVYSVGEFGVTVDFDPGSGTFNLTSAGDQDAFVSKLSGGALAAGDVANTLEVQHAGDGDITVSWGNSCAATDDDYAIYEGTIGSW